MSDLYNLKKHEADTGDLQRIQTIMTVDGAVTIQDGTVFFNKAGVLAATLAAPTAGLRKNGGHDGLRITFIAKQAQANTLTVTTIGVNEGDGGKDVGTFGGAIGDGCTLEAYNGEWYVVSNINVTFA